MQSQESRPPPVAAPGNEAPFGSPRPQGHPVKNTFIHYGTPIRGTTGCGGTPKTVPPDFAPEGQLLDLRLEPFPSQPSGPLASPMPNTGGRPGPEAWRAGADRDGQPARGRGVAPLKLFDFLPSPTLQAAPPQQVVQFMPQAQAPTAAFMPPPAPPPPLSVGAGSGVSQAAPAMAAPFYQPQPHLEAGASTAPPPMSVAVGSMAPAPTYAPMSFGTDGLQASGLQPAAGLQQVGWPFNTAAAAAPSPLELFLSGAQPPAAAPAVAPAAAQQRVQLPAATAHCLGPVNNPVAAPVTVPGAPMPSGGNAVTMMAAAPMFMAPQPQALTQPLPLPPSKP